MFSIALWIYRRVWICFVIRICQGFEYAKDTDGSEYAWVCTWIMLKYAWICLKQNLKSLYKLRSIYRDSGIQNPAKNLKWSKKERLAKTNYSLELLRHYKIFDRDVSAVEFLNISRIWGFWISHGLWICLSSEFARVHNIMSMRLD